MSENVIDDIDQPNSGEDLEYSKYPVMSERVQALVADWVVLLVLIVSFTYLFNSIGRVSDQVRMIAFIFVFFLYEPLFVSLFGGSIGHYMMGLRVKRDSNHSKNVFILIAIFRYAIKIMLGILSLITISSDPKRRAIHDKLSGSIVIYKAK